MAGTVCWHKEPRMGKFFFKADERVGDKVYLTGAVAHHMLKVLRFRVGEQVVLCDGKCTDYAARLEEIIAKPPSARFALLSKSPPHTEPPINLTLYQGIPKGDKMDWIIEKCIEVGICKIVPVCTSRSVVKIKDAAKRTERYSRIAESAAAQSMRGILPIVTPPLSFGDALASTDSECLHLAAYENERDRSIKSILSTMPPKPISLWIGPEGGFEDNEIKQLTEKNAIPITLGPRILRTETAGIVALSHILCIWG